MFGLDQLISGLGHGASPVVVLAVAVLLGLRHATDPDHLVAVSTLVATERERRVRRAGLLGLAWGLGHATSLLVLGLPFVLVAALLPAPVESGAEVLIGGVIMLLALRLYLRWRRGAFHAHAHRHGRTLHRHLHAHEHEHGHEHAHRVRSPLASYGIGIVHGVGGSAGVALLLLAGIADRTEAVAALVLFALATAVSMAVLSSGVGLALGVDSVQRRFVPLVPVLAVLAFGFGLTYSTAALGGAF
jgi:ABC-type nickel/cobalt efflux system permease component RcnA